MLAGYDAVIHLVTCAKGAEFAYNLGNTARTESLEYAREMDDRTLRAWRGHPNLHIIDNSVNFEDKINRAIVEIYRLLGEPEPMVNKRKFLVDMPNIALLTEKYGALVIDMMQTYLCFTQPGVERRIRQQENGEDYRYFYTEKHVTDDGEKWVTEKPISEKQYLHYLMEGDDALHSVRKKKHRFIYGDCRFELDVYPFSNDRAVLFMYGEAEIPPEITVIREVTGDPAYKNRQLAKVQAL